MGLNHIYKVIWSKTKNAWVVVSEIAKRDGKSSVKSVVTSVASKGIAATVVAMLLCGGITSAASFATPGATASGTDSVAIGDGVTATGEGGVAIGARTVAEKSTGDELYLQTGTGLKSSATGKKSLAIQGEATEENATAIQGVAKGQGTVAIGYSLSKGKRAVGLGWNSMALGTSAIAIGEGAKATNTSAIAQGTGAEATGAGSVAIGRGVDYSHTTDPGSFITTSSGVNSIAVLGWASGKNAIAQGYYSISKSENGIAIGTEAKTEPDTSSSITSSINNIAIGTRAKSIGYTNIALGDSSQVNGSYNLALGSNAFAEGSNNSALGGSTKVNGVMSSSIGTGSLASGNYSSAIGSGYVLGDNSVSINSSVRGNSSVAINGSAGIIPFFYAATYNGTLLENANNGTVNKSVAIGGDVTTDKTVRLGGSDQTFVLNQHRLLSDSPAIHTNKNELITPTKIKAQPHGAGTNPIFPLANATGGTSIGYVEGTLSNSIYLGYNSFAITDNVETDSETSSSGEKSLHTKSYDAIGHVVTSTNTTGGAFGLVRKTDIDDTTFTNFAGGQSVGAVTIGGGGTERRIQNVAAGEMSATSTDAVNGSQLYSTAKTLLDRMTNYVHVNDGTTTQKAGTTSSNKGILDTVGGATGKKSVAIGVDTQAAGENGVAVGNTAKATGKNSVAQGADAEATEEDAIAIGNGAKAQGEKSISIGTGNIVKAAKSSVIGDPSHLDTSATGTHVQGNDNGTAAAPIMAKDSTFMGNNNLAGTAGTEGIHVVGNNNNIQSSNVMVLGNGVTASTGYDGAVILGNASATRAYTAPTNTTINGVTLDASKYAGTAAAGSTLSQGSIVSVGDAGKERQIKNVAAGEVSATSTDAVTGSQLYGAVKALTESNSSPDVYVHVNDGTTTQKAGNATTNAGKTDEKGGATGTKSIAIGINAQSFGENSIAVGTTKEYNNITHKWETVGSKAIQKDSIALNGQALGEKAIAVNGTAGANAIAINGTSATSGITISGTADSNSVAIGMNSLAGQDSVTIGDSAKDYGQENVVIGKQASVNSFMPNKYSTVIGSNAVVAGSQSSLALGHKTYVGGTFVNLLAPPSGTSSYRDISADKAGSIGYGIGVHGSNTVAIGIATTATTGFSKGGSSEIFGNNSGVFGNDNNINWKYNDNQPEGIRIIGNNNDVTDTSNVMILGNNVTIESKYDTGKDLSGAVILGNDSKADGYVAPIDSTINGVNFESSNYAGVTGLTDGSIVSIGKVGAERQIKNVAAGAITATSTDAVNGSQLHSFAKTILTTPLKMAGDSGDTLAPTLSKTVNIKGAITTGADVTDGNIAVVGDSASNTLNLKMAKNLTGLTSGTFTDATGNQTVINGTGVTVTPTGTGATTISITTSGINAGNQEIKGVKKGTTDDAAVNKKQMDDALAGISSTLTINDGTTDGSVNIKTGKLKVVGESGANALVTTTVSGDTITVGTSTKLQNAVTAAEKSANKDLSNLSATGSNKVKTLAQDAVKVDGTGLATVSNSMDASGNKTYTVNVDEGKLVIDDTTGKVGATGSTQGTTAGKDGVATTKNVADVVNSAIDKTTQALADAEHKFDGDTGTTSVRKHGEVLSIKGGVATSADLTTGNIGVVSDGAGTLNIRLAKVLTGLTSATYTDAAGNTQTVTGGSTTISDAAGNSTVVSKGGVTTTDAAGNTTTTAPTGVTVTPAGTGATPISVTTSGISAGNKEIKNVANGTTDDAAVNKKQMDDALKGATDNTVSLGSESGSTTAKKLSTTGGIKFNIKGETGANALITTSAAGDDVTIAPTAKLTAAVTAAEKSADKDLSNISTAGETVIKNLAKTAASWNVETNGAGTTAVAGGETVNFINGDNIAITNTGRSITIGTVKNVSFDKVTVGGVVINKTDGINAGNTEIKNVAAGTTATSAVNKGQMETAIANAQTAATSTEKVVAKTLTGDTNLATVTGQTGTAKGETYEVSVSENAVKAVATTAAQDAVKVAGTGLATVSDATAAGVKTYTVNVDEGKLVIDDTTGKVGAAGATQGTTAGKDGVATTQNVASVVNAAIDKTTQALADAKHDFAGDDSTVISRKHGEQLNIKGGASTTATDLTSGNIAVVGDTTSGTLNIKLAKVLTGLTSTTYTDAAGNTQTVTGGSTTISDAAGNSTVVSKGGVTTTDAAGNTTTTAPTGVTVTPAGTGATPISVTTSGISAGNKEIKNVANGTTDDAAVNKKQMDDALKGATDNTVSLGSESGSTTAKKLSTTGGIKFNIKGETGANALITTSATGDDVTVAPTAKLTAAVTAAENAANKDLSNLTAAGDTYIKNLAKAAASWNVETNGAGTTAVAGGETVNFINGDNIAITNTGRAITIGTAKNVSFDKVTVGGVVIDKTDGINAGNTEIKNVAAGTTATSAVNKGQMETAIANAQTAATSTEKVVAKTLTGDTNLATVTGQTGTAKGETYEVSVSENAVKAVAATAAQDAVKVAGTGLATVSDATAAGVKTYTVNVDEGKLVIDDTTGKVGAAGATQGTTAGKDGVATTQNVASVVNAAIDKTTQALADAKHDFAGDDSTVISRKHGEQLNIKGGASTTATDLTSGNIAVVGDTTSGTLNIKLAKVLTGLTSTTYTDAAGNTQTVTGGSTTISDAAGNSTVVSKGGVTTTDAAGNTTTTAPTGVTVTPAGTGATPISVTTSGISAGNKEIKNVANGTTDDAAVNKKQMDDALKGATDNTVSLGSESGSTTAKKLSTTGGITFNIKGETGANALITTSATGDDVTVAPTAKLTAAVTAAEKSADKDLSNLSAAGDTYIKNLAKTAATWNVETNGTGTTAVAGGDTVNFINGDNIAITNTGRAITIGTAKNVSFDKVTVGGVVIDKTDGINAGNTEIKNVAAGTTATSAVNKGQMETAIANAQTAATSTEKVVAKTLTGDTNLATVTGQTGTAKGETYEVSVSENAVKAVAATAAQDAVKVAGTGLATVSDATAAGVKTYTVNVDEGKLVIDDTTGKVGATGATQGTTAGKDGVATTKNVADVVNSAIDKTTQALADAEHKFDGDTGTTSVRKHGEVLSVKGGIATPTDLTTGNIGVVSDGAGTLNIRLAKSLTGLTSASFTTTGGDTSVINGSGITITPSGTGTSAISMTTNGINAGGKEIKGVANGTSADAAVNKGQLDAAVLSAAGGALSIEKVEAGSTANGKLAAGDTNLATVSGLTGTAKNETYVVTVSENAVKAVATTAAQDAVKVAGTGLATVSDATAAGVKTYTVNVDEGKLVIDDTTGKVGAAGATQGTTAGKDGVATTQNVASVVNAAIDKTTQALADAKHDFAGDDSTVISRKHGEQLNIKGGASTTATDLTSGNIAVVGDTTSGTLNIKLAKVLTGLTSTTYTDAAGNTQTVTGGSTTISDAAGNSTVVSKGGVTTTDAAGNTTTTAPTGVTVTPAGTGATPISVTTSGISAGNKEIKNVANGTTDDAAVNKKQMDDALKGATDNTVSLGSESGTTTAKKLSTTGGIKFNIKGETGANALITTSATGDDVTVAPTAKLTAAVTAAENAANKDLSNLTAAGDTYIKNLAKAAASWNVETNGAGTTAVAGGETVNFINGDNIAITNTGRSITIGTAKNVAFDKVSVGGVVIDKTDGINAGNKEIKGIATGTTNDAAVNKGQLDAAIATVSSGASSTEKVVAKTLTGDTNLATVTGQTGTAKGETYEVSVSENAVKAVAATAAQDAVKVAGTGLATVSDATAAGVKTYTVNVDEGKLVIDDTTGKVGAAGATQGTTAGKDGVATTQNVASVVNAAIDKTTQALADAKHDFAGDDSTVISRKHGEKLNIKGGASTTAADLTSGNIAVLGDATTGTLNIRMAKALTGLSSATFTTPSGTTVINGGGMTITPASGSPISVTTGGINAGNTEIRGVAAATHGDAAVNKAQMDTAIANAASVASSTEKVIAKTLTGDTNLVTVTNQTGTPQGETYEVAVSENAIKAAAQDAVKVAGTGLATVSDATAAGVKTYTVNVDEGKLVIDDTTGKVGAAGATQGTTAGKDGVATTQNVASVVNAAIDKTTQALADAKHDFAGDDSTVISRKHGEQLNIKGGASTTATDLTSGNIAVVGDTTSGTLNIKLAKVLTGLTSTTYTDAAGNTQTVTGGSTTISDAAGNSTVVSKGGVTTTDAAGNTTTTAPTGVTVTPAGTGATPISVTTSGISAGNKEIKNVANGTTDDAAVNKKQMDDALKGATDNTVSLGSESGTTTAKKLSTTGGIKFNIKGETGANALITTSATGDDVTVAPTAKLTAAVTAAENAANKDLSNLTAAGDTYIKNLAKAAASWNVETNGAGTTAVAGGETVNFINGDNIAITNTGRSITIGTAKNVAFDKVSVGGVVIDKTDGINAGNKEIKGIATGTTNDAAVNKGQLDAAIATVSSGASSTEKVVAKTLTGDTNLATVTGQTGTAKGETYEVSVSENAVKAVAATAAQDAVKVAGTGLATVSDATAAGVKTYTVNVDEGKLVIDDTTGKVGAAGATQGTTAGKDGVATTQNVASVVNAAIDKTTQALADAKHDFAGDDSTVISRKHGEKLNIKGGASTTAADLTSGNIAVLGDATTGTLNIRMAKALTGLSSATFTTPSGTTVINGGGMTITPASGSPISVTTGGINAGNTEIKNVAAGTTATSAVNKQQMDNAISNATANVGFNTAGNTGTGSVSNGQTLTITGTNGIETNASGQSITVGLDAATRAQINNATTTANNAAKKDLSNIDNAGKQVIKDTAAWNVKVNSGTSEIVKGGDTVTFKDGDNIKVTNTGKDITIATKKDVSFDKVTVGNVVIDKATNRISGLANAANNDEAVNLGQMTAAINAVSAGSSTIKYKANNGTTNTVALTTGFDFKGDSNIQITADPANSGVVNYKLNPALTGITSITGSGTGAPTISINAPSGSTPGNVSINSNLDMGGKQINNVGPATHAGDAVNKQQLDQALQGLAGASSNVAKSYAYKAGAGAAALAALKPIQYDPLEPTQIMAGVGNYKSQTAVALGVAHYTNENTMFNLGVSLDSHDGIVNAGVTHKFGYSPEKKAIPDKYKGGPISSIYVMQDEVTALQAIVQKQAAENEALRQQNEDMQRKVDMILAKIQ